MHLGRGVVLLCGWATVRTLGQSCMVLNGLGRVIQTVAVSRPVSDWHESLMTPDNRLTVFLRSYVSSATRDFQIAVSRRRRRRTTELPLHGQC